jgi:hypothetical protein
LLGKRASQTESDRAQGGQHSPFTSFDGRCNCVLTFTTNDISQNHFSTVNKNKHMREMLIAQILFMTAGSHVTRERLEAMNQEELRMCWRKLLDVFS